MIRNTNNFEVSPNTPVAVSTLSIMKSRDFDLYDKIIGDAIEINGGVMWITTAQNAVNLRLDCTVVEGRTLLNSHIRAADNG